MLLTTPGPATATGYFWRTSSGIVLDLSFESAVRQGFPSGTAHQLIYHLREGVEKTHRLVAVGFRGGGPAADLSGHFHQQDGRPGYGASPLVDDLSAFHFSGCRLHLCRHLALDVHPHGAGLFQAGAAHVGTVRFLDRKS